MTDQLKEVLNAVGSFLFYCWLYGFVLLLIGFGVTQLMAQPVYKLHGAMFGMSSHEPERFFYSWLGLIKLNVLTFFFIPWLAVKSLLRAQKTK
ncbi:MAG: hypothetical protein GY758_00045 [Fuerstiella sp.]|jgi:hypothetical protein|nr:hypothetical protein [Fuerstiella sp.]MCP4511410.1 hypothetical protein [Fuerstiella sp.]MDG2131835.1 hypothetical protein [Fuerstiella sp.]